MSSESKASVSIVTPIYRSPLTKDEESSLKVLASILDGYPRFFLFPESFEVPHKFKGQGTHVRFPDKYFTYPYGYNRMLLRRRFYDQFCNFDFMLIYQLDCVVFRNELNHWANKGYDYIGSPWFVDEAGKAVELPQSVGNGGFSLRKISTARRVLTSRIRRGSLFSKPPVAAPQPHGSDWFLWNLRRRIRQHCGLWRVQDELENYFENEDVFWSMGAPKIYPPYRKAPLNDALAFGMEVNPRRCVDLNSGRIPFGCHAWWKHDREFVEPLFVKNPQSKSRVHSEDY